MEPHQAGVDVTQAQSMGIDAFALNIISLEPWATNTIEWLFEAARPTNFRLFFSFDMLHFKHPRDFFPLLRKYIGHESYYNFEGKGVVSEYISLNIISFKNPAGILEPFFRYSFLC